MSFTKSIEESIFVLDRDAACNYLSFEEENEFYSRYPFIAPGSCCVPTAGSGFHEIVLEENEDLAKRKRLLDSLTEEYSEAKAIKPSTAESRAVAKAVRVLLDEKMREYVSVIETEVALRYWTALYNPFFIYRYAAAGRVMSMRQLIGRQLGAESVFDYGPKKSNIMLIGKAPMNDEVTKNAMFDTESGQVLLNMLGMLGVDYSKWYATYISKVTSPNRGGGVYPAAIIRDYAPILANEIRIVQPEYILCLGSEAVKAVLDRSKNVTNTAGCIFDVEFALPGDKKHNAKVMSCVSPAITIFDPSAKDELQQGLERFIDLSEGKRLYEHSSRRDYEVVRTNEELTRLVDALLEAEFDRFAVDLEWDGNFPLDIGAYVRSFQFSWGVGKAVSIVLAGVGGAVTPLAKSHFRKELLRLMDRDGVRIIGHYFLADAVWIEYLGLSPIVDRFCEDLVDDPETGRFGWEFTKTRGGFDTILAAHAVHETGSFSLKDLALRYTSMGPYDSDLVKWREENPKAVVTGFGNIPDDILLPYGAADVDATFRLFMYFNGMDQFDGMLDQDRFKNCCREPFWKAMRAWRGFYDMHKNGLLLDLEQYDKLRSVFEKKRDEKTEEIRRLSGWPDFNPDSTRQRTELLFGEQYTGEIDADGHPVRFRPAGAITIGLEPYKTTGNKDAKLWSQLDESEWKDYRPSTDKESLSYLSSSHPIVSALQQCTKLSHICSTLLVAPDTSDFGEPVYTRGPRAWLSGDGRLHSFFSQTKETGRASSSKPPMQNWTKRFEKLYKQLLGDDYPGPVRSMIKARPGWVLVEADLTAAEVAAAAWMSGDVNLIDHAYRSTLPEEHPDHYDIHSHTAVNTFKLSVAPTKTALEEAGLIHLRTAAKTRFFGWFYGQGDLAAWRKIKEDGADVSLDEVRELSSKLEETYPMLVKFLASAGTRVDTHGWLCNAGGRFRRFYPTERESVRKAQKREAGNFYIQGLVAEAMNEIIYNFVKWKRNNPDHLFELVLQVHDSLLFECPIEQAHMLCTEIIPYCMIESVPIIPCSLGGTPRREGPYRFGIDVDVYSAWSVKLDKALAEKYKLTKEDIKRTVKR